MTFRISFLEESVDDIHNFGMFIYFQFPLLIKEVWGMECQRDLFDLEENVTYLNNAAYSPIMKSSREAGIKGINLKSNPQNITPSRHFTEHFLLREKLNELINGNDPDRIAIFPSVSYGMAIVAANLERVPNITQKKTILVLQEEFPNDYYAFSRVAERLNLDIVTISSTSDIESMGEIWNDNIINAINPDTALVVVPYVHWFYGIVFNLQEISTKCRANGALMVIDGTQAIGAVPFDVQSIQPDALIVAAYKWLFGPYSIGFGYFGPFFDDGVPLEETWMNRTNSENFSGLTVLDQKYRPLAQRYNMGEFSEFINTPMLIDSVSYLLALGVPEIQSYVVCITKEPLDALIALGCQFTSPEFRPSHLFGLQLPSCCSPPEVVASLRRQNIIVSLRGPLIRVAVSVYNDEDDLWKLVRAIEKEIEHSKNTLSSSQSS